MASCAPASGWSDAHDLIADLDQALRARSFKGLVGPLERLCS